MYAEQFRTFLFGGGMRLKIARFVQRRELCQRVAEAVEQEFGGQALMNRSKRVKRWARVDGANS
jgi:hypothetical protein